MKILRLTPNDDLQKTINGLTEPAIIYLKSGVYCQKTEITASNITLIGEDCESTVLSYGDYAKKIHNDGKEYNTFRTYTLCVCGENVKLKNLTVENTNTQPENVGQCVALSVNCKRFYAENCRFISTQDTVFCYPFPDDLVIRYRDFLPQRQLYTEGRSLHIFNGCEIYGTVDFIFGGAKAFFYDCNVISVKDNRNVGYIAAPCHPLAEEDGFTFINCRLKNGGAKKESVYLARPWRDFGKCNFINCTVESHVSPLLFDKWNNTERDKTARFGYYGLITYFEKAPVVWCNQLKDSQALKLICQCEKAIEEYKTK